MVAIDETMVFASPTSPREVNVDSIACQRSTVCLFKATPRRVSSSPDGASKIMIRKLRRIVPTNDSVELVADGFLAELGGTSR